MKRLVLVLVFTCAVSLPTLAGNIPTVGVTPPPPPPSDGVQVSQTTAPGEIPTGGLNYQIADTALDFIQMMLSAGI